MTNRAWQPAFNARQICAGLLLAVLLLLTVWAVEAELAKGTFTIKQYNEKQAEEEIVIRKASEM